MASSDPVYLRVVEDLRRQIRDGLLPPGASIPSRAQLTRKYGVGETAARHALRVLAAEGLIYGRVGSGHYVRDRPVLTPLHRWRHHDHHAPMAADLQNQNRRITCTWRVERAEAGRAIGQRLRVPESAPVVRTRYVIRDDNSPVQIAWSYEPMGPGDAAEGQILPTEGSGDRQGLVTRMAAQGIKITEIVETVRTRIPEPTEIDALDLVAGAHVLHVERTHLAGDRPVETSDIIVSGDLFSLVYSIPVPT
ncbi:GntR family transcriptional regulator [Thermocatellispora tengchongensis]|uniref:GntR family transcriptional regulator n=1 Tax=Thermocatellispora tengchongensis TaxID=1073253 RepID=A0A840P1D2_9ACTN|nr:GntR family transcriptional regulator [Thermocatellispora tengchongensis]MBB5133182.1 GntR family transcriptional regulator [Thermocatellispora tengchongensis]